MAYFDELKPGLYLTAAKSVTQDETTYIFDSSLIAIR